MAAGEGVASVPCYAGAEHNVVGGRAVSIDAAYIGAGVRALLLLADLVACALSIHVALRLAVGWAAHKAWQAGALFLVAVDHPALGVGPAGRGRAGLLGRGRLGDLHTAEERVARVAGVALADWLVLHHLAGSVRGTCPHARVLALLPDAGLVGPAVGRDEALGPAVRGLPVVARGAAAHHARAEDLDEKRLKGDMNKCPCSKGLRVQISSTTIFGLGIRNSSTQNCDEIIMNPSSFTNSCHETPKNTRIPHYEYHLLIS